MGQSEYHTGTPADVVVIGAGLFGQIIAKALAADGRDVLILDDARPYAGSRPAACLMKPSWFSSLGKGVYEPSLRLLDALYGVQDVAFKAGKLLNATVHWIPPAKILEGNPVTQAKVLGVKGKLVYYQDLVDGQVKEVVANTVVVAAGIWSEELLPGLQQQGQKGIAFLKPREWIDQPIITPWAPYRQLVAFNRGDGLWVSDGTAIKAANWTMEREVTAFERCQKHVGINLNGSVALTGIRPYAKGHKPCLLKEVEPGLWVASGGAKNGTLAAGWCAHEIRRKS